MKIEKVFVLSHADGTFNEYSVDQLARMYRGGLKPNEYSLFTTHDEATEASERHGAIRRVNAALKMIDTAVISRIADQLEDEHDLVNTDWGRAKRAATQAIPDETGYRNQ